MRDQGPGLTPDECQQASQRFWRKYPGTSGSGLGLGLTLVQRIADVQTQIQTQIQRQRQPYSLYRHGYCLKRMIFQDESRLYREKFVFVVQYISF